LILINLTGDVVAVHVLVLAIEWTYYVHGTNKIILSYYFQSCFHY